LGGRVKKKKRIGEKGERLGFRSIKSLQKTEKKRKNVRLQGGGEGFGLDLRSTAYPKKFSQTGKNLNLGRRIGDTGGVSG